MGISLYELSRYSESLEYLKEAQNFDDTQTAAECWFKYVEEINKA